MVNILIYKYKMKLVYDIIDANYFLRWNYFLTLNQWSLILRLYSLFLLLFTVEVVPYNGQSTCLLYVLFVLFITLCCVLDVWALGVDLSYVNVLFGLLLHFGARVVLCVGDRDLFMLILFCRMVYTH